MLKKAGLSNKEIEKYKKEEIIRNFETSLSESKYKCMDINELFNTLSDIAEHPCKELILRNISNKNLNKNQVKKLYRIILELDNTTKNVKYNIKTKIDRVISRLVWSLNLELAREWGIKNLIHSRKLRRTKSFKLLKKIGIGKDNYDEVIKIFNKKREQKYLELLVRDDEAVKHLDTFYLLNNIKEEYWRARVIEVLISERDFKKIKEIYLDFSWEFIYASGRAKEPECLDYIRKIIKMIKDYNNINNLKILGISAWTFGELRSKKDIQYLKKIFDNKVKRNVG